MKMNKLSRVWAERMSSKNQLTAHSVRYTLGESVFAVDVVAVGVPGVGDSLSFSMLLRASHRLPSCFDSLETSTIGGRRAARKVTLYNGCDTGTESTGPEQTID